MKKYILDLAISNLALFDIMKKDTMGRARPPIGGKKKKEKDKRETQKDRGSEGYL